MLLSLLLLLLSRCLQSVGSSRPHAGLDDEPGEIHFSLQIPPRMAETSWREPEKIFLNSDLRKMFPAYQFVPRDDFFTSWLVIWRMLSWAGGDFSLASHRPCLLISLLQNSAGPGGAPGHQAGQLLGLHLSCRSASLRTWQRAKYFRATRQEEFGRNSRVHTVLVVTVTAISTAP